MAKPLRIEYPGVFYQVTSRGNEQKDVVTNQKDREKFLSYLEDDVARVQQVLQVLGRGVPADETADRVLGAGSGAVLKGLQTELGGSFRHQQCQDLPRRFMISMPNTGNQENICYDTAQQQSVASPAGQGRGPFTKPAHDYGAYDRDLGDPQ